jgi:transposase
MRSKRNQNEFDNFAKYKKLLHLWERDGLIDVAYFDETGFNLTPNIPYAWQEKNETIEISSNSSSTLSVLGFLRKSNQFQGYTVDGTVNTDIVINCFNDFCNTIKKDTIVILDNASIHTSKAFKAEIEGWKKKKLMVTYLPTYSSELNDIEIIWRFFKYEWMPFEAYQSKDKLHQNIGEIIKKIGVEYVVNFNH